MHRGAVAAFADTTVLRYIFGVEPDLLFSKSSGTVAAPAPAAQSTLSEPLLSLIHISEPTRPY